MNKDFIYGIARVRFNNNTIGYIEKGSWDWGGSKAETVDVDAEQVPEAPVLILQQKGSQISPTFNMIQLNYQQLQRLLGGTLVNTGEGQDAAVTGWEAPTNNVQIQGSWEIDFVSGQTMSIPNGLVLSNLGGKLSLTEVSKLECQLKIMKPNNGGSPYKINNTPEEG